MEPVFTYFDYREFLRDFYQKKKAEQSFFSYRYMAQKTGIDQGNLVRILNGSLHLAVKKIKDVCKLCGFDENESRYFESLVLFNRAKSEEERTIFFEQLLDIKGVESHVLARDQYRFFSNWYNAAIWGILNYFPLRDKDGESNYAEMADLLIVPIGIRKLKESVELLERLGLIEKDDQGGFKVTQRNITTGKMWHSIAISRFRKEMIQLSLNSYDKVEREHQDISAVTMNMPYSAIEEFRDAIRKFRESILNMAEKYSSDPAVFQLNMQLFPLVKPPLQSSPKSSPKPLLKPPPESLVKSSNSGN